MRIHFVLLLAAGVAACSAISRKSEDKPTEQVASPLDMPKDEGPMVTLVKKGTDEPVESKDMTESATKNKWKQSYPEGEAAAVPKNLWGNSLKTPEAQATGATDWSYSGDTGPEHWSKLSADYALCGEGQRQSPIDLKWHKPQKDDEVVLNYKASAAHVENTGHAVQIAFDAGSTARIHGHEYDLMSAQFHLGSEHS